MLGMKTGQLMLPPSVLTGVIADSFSHQELVKLMSSLGAVYPGVRMASLDHLELAEHFSRNAWEDPELMKSLTLALDKVHREDREEIRVWPIEEVKKLLSTAPEILREQKTGKIVWVLFRDERLEVQEFLPEFLAAIGKQAEKEHKELEKSQDFRKRYDKGRLKKVEVLALKDLLLSTSRELEEVKKRLEHEQRKAKALEEERDRCKEEIKAQRREKDALASELGRVKRELHEREESVARLTASLKKAPGDEIEKIRQNLHFFEREHRKLEHELVRLEKKASESQKELESRQSLCARLSQDLEAALREKELLKEKVTGLVLERESKNKAELQPNDSSVKPRLKAQGKRLGIFVDMQNILITAKRFERRIDFQKLLDFLVLDRHLVKAVAYVILIPEWDQEPFFEMLRRKGFELRTRTLIRRMDGSAKGNWDTGIVVDAIHLVEENHLDIVLVVSGDGDFIDLLKFLKTKGVSVEAAGFPFNTAQDLPKIADQFFALDEGILKIEEKISSRL